jgi:hypothetical protein
MPLTVLGDADADAAQHLVGVGRWNRQRPKPEDAKIAHTLADQAQSRCADFFDLYLRRHERAQLGKRDAVVDGEAFVGVGLHADRLVVYLAKTVMKLAYIESVVHNLSPVQYVQNVVNFLYFSTKRPEQTLNNDLASGE